MTIRFPTFTRARDVARASDAGRNGTRRSEKYSRARRRRAVRASDRTRVVEAMETPIPRMNECVSRPPMTRRRATRRSIDETRLARRGRSISTASNARARVVDSVSVARGVASTSRSIGHVVCRTAISKIIHECDASRASSHTSARGRPARGRRRARERSAAHRPRRRLRRVSRVSRARENDDEGKKRHDPAHRDVDVDIVADLARETRWRRR